MFKTEVTKTLEQLKMSTQIKRFDIDMSTSDIDIKFHRDSYPKYEVVSKLN
jgi:hypothetical protein